MATVKKTILKKATTKTDKPIPAPKKAVALKEAQPIASSKLFHLSDDDIDIEAFEKLVNHDIPAEKTKASRSLSALANVCPQGKQPKVIRDNPKQTPPLNTAKYISELHVKLSTQNLRITWTDGTVQNILCSPNPSLTPKGNDVVGNKCGPKHTNFKRDGMAWFTALRSRGMAYGFHNSQRVGIGVVSHGCIRVSCDHAKIVNQNSWSGKTKIKIIG